MSAFTLPDLMRRRFDMVARLSEATSQLQKAQQIRMSVEMDIQRVDMAPEGAAPQLQQEKENALVRAQAADEAIVRCDTLIAELEASLDETDREIATLSARPS